MNSTLRLWWPALALAVLSPLVAQEADEQKTPVLSPSKELELYNLREIAKLRTLSRGSGILSPTNSAVAVDRAALPNDTNSNWIASGTASFTFNGDASTGFYKGASNTLAFSYKGQHVFSSTNMEAVGWLMMRLFQDTNAYKAKTHIGSGTAKNAPSNTDIASGSLSLEGGRHELPDTYRDTVVRDTNPYGSLYNVTSNWPGYNLVIERRATNRVSGVRTYPGDAVERHFNPVTPYWPGPPRTNPPTVHAWGTQYHPTATGEVKPLAPPAPVTNAAQVLFTFKGEGYELKLIKVPTQQPVAPARAEQTNTWYTEGPTTKPSFLIEPSGATSTGWSTAGNGFSRLTFGPHWLIPRMAEVALQWEPTIDTAPAYRVYARSSKSTNQWVSKPEWLFAPGYTGEAVNFSVVLDLSVPTWTKVVAIDNYSREESPATAPVLHSALTPIKPPGQHKVMYVRPLNEPVAHRSRMAPLPFPPIP